mgnify:CR=1 FL=1
MPKAKLDQCHGQPQEVIHASIGSDRGALFGGSPDGRRPDCVDGDSLHHKVLVVPMYHPAAAAPGRNPKLVPIMYDDWRKLGALLAGRRVRPLGNYRLTTGFEIDSLLMEMYVVKGTDMLFAFDLETTDPMWHDTFQAHRARPIGFSVSLAAGTGLYTTDSPEWIKPWLEYTRIWKFAHNAKF